VSSDAANPGSAWLLLGGGLSFAAALHPSHASLANPTGTAFLAAEEGMARRGAW
jgi:hypothetical protein